MMDFKDWVVRFGKSFVPEELAYRRGVFAANSGTIELHNADPRSTFKMALNEHAATTADEFRERYLSTFVPREGFPRLEPSAGAAPAAAANDTVAPRFLQPSSFDWAAVNMVGPVRNQGNCDSSYAFGSVGAMESVFRQYGFTNMVLSVAQVRDCSFDEGNQGCSGGSFDSSFEYAVNNQMCTWASYPYTDTTGTCQETTCSKVAKIASYYNVVPNDYTAFKNRLLLQPVSVAIDADFLGFMFYSSGVYTGSCGTNVNFGMLATGMGLTSGGLPYYRLKNSLGTSWGESGFMRLSASTSYGPEGACGILTVPTYPRMT